MNHLLLLTICWITFNTYAQSAIDSTDLQKFWSESVTPIILKDKKKLESIIQFPLSGDWGYMIGLDKADSLWTQQDFFDNYDKLFNKRVFNSLKNQDFNDAEVISQGTSTEIIVGVGWKDEDGISEFGILLRFKLIDGIWKLHLIQGVG